MAVIRPHCPVLLIMALISRHDSAIEWAGSRAEAAFGPIALRSESFPFTQTDYYEKAMGRDLLKQFVAFERLIDPSELIDIKITTNQWESDYRSQSDHVEQRPLNLDPGYISQAKLILATTKDRDHRIYLGRGIYAEGTLYFHHGRWQTREWTYPDYRSEAYHDFFTQCRDYLRKRFRESPTT